MTQTQSDVKVTQASSINPSNCDPFIIGFVDARLIQNGKPDGLFFIDTSNVPSSAYEGTSQLRTACRLNAKIAWVAYGFNPYDYVQIQFIGNSDAWGGTGQPYPAGDDIFTGQVQNATGGGYQIELQVKPANAPNFVAPKTQLDVEVVNA